MNLFKTHSFPGQGNEKNNFIKELDIFTNFISVWKMNTDKASSEWSVSQQLICLQREDNLFLTGFLSHISHSFQAPHLLHFPYLQYTHHTYLPTQSVSTEMVETGKGAGVLVGNQDREKSISPPTLHKWSATNGPLKLCLWSVLPQNPSFPPLPSFPTHCS